jgi:UPF0716 protein FxsA
MKPFQIIFIVILLIPLLEIYLLVEIGEIIGAMPTILLVVFTAISGAWLLRQQGFETFRRFQQSLAQGEIPAYEIIEGPIILLGGVLLLTPGFFTDLLGLICLIPPVRRKVAQYILEKHLIQASGFYQPATVAKNNILEGEYRKED